MVNEKSLKNLKPCFSSTNQPENNRMGGCKFLTPEHRLKAIMTLNRGVGDKNRNWKGGRRRDADGYMTIYQGPGKYKLEHRLIMEKHLGRKLDKWETVHHINGIKDDNRLENLQLMTGWNHRGEVECPHCKLKFLVP